jgi:predicted nuclease of predicted toxin-antitoxin system
LQVRFVVDAQLPPALARFISGCGHICHHVGDIGFLNAEDNPIWRHAEANGAVIITKDEDFAKRKTFRPKGPQVVWLRAGNCSNRALLSWLQPLLPSILERLQNGEPLIEVI